MTGPLSDQQLDEIQAHVPNCRYGCDACEAFPGLAAEVRELRTALAATTATQWIDDRDGSTYDLTTPLRDCNGDYWHHIGWLTLPDRIGPTPMVMWSLSADRAALGRRWADVAPLVTVIDESGPFGADLEAALDAKAKDDRIEVERTQ